MKEKNPSCPTVLSGEQACEIFIVTERDKLPIFGSEESVSCDPCMKEVTTAHRNLIFITIHVCCLLYQCCTEPIPSYVHKWAVFCAFVL